MNLQHLTSALVRWARRGRDRDRGRMPAVASPRTRPEAPGTPATPPPAPAPTPGTFPARDAVCVVSRRATPGGAFVPIRSFPRAARAFHLVRGKLRRVPPGSFGPGVVDHPPAA